ncbi:heparinase II/III family protein [Parabacteroides sp. AF17-28]|uniref:heparinase II/III domain-containing protein n=1 Tax=Parabacteroides sp. AF17-28 TaxID=2292241 RepID=UPI000F004768|nr:heparinase II/III family protein [Parabacteroides sp. AF17-28]RHR56934.1 heparinase [Parabacteroides sp. AF17-28]
MKTRIIVFLMALLCCHCFSFAQKEFVSQSTRLGGHPRILLQKGEEKALKKVIMKDAIWKDIHQSLLDEAEDIVKLPLNERIKTGKRLLSVSRENLRRIFILSYAYRMSGKSEFLKRAENEMLKAASFSDWNPSHFLDVGEMTMALAIGYDWLYPQLSAQTKTVIEKAIVEKGLKPSFDERYNWFVDAVHNWNQVCHAGVTYGALAIWEKEPELSRTVINRAIDKISIPMGHYAPDGAYPEGVGYWDYGTSFNAMFLSAIEKIFGTDYGLSQLPGFLKTGEYILHAVTPGLKNFAYSDNGANAFLAPTMFWFYDKTKDASILYNQAQLYKKDGQKRIKRDRLAPAMLIWGASASLANPQKPVQLSWKAQGDNPVCFMRSSWNDPLAVYVGVKMGSPSVNHGHMDVGSFLFEADGVLWGMDLGGEDYNRLETRGVDLWNTKQNSQRWDVYRYNNLAHNTLSFNHKYQNVKGKAQIDGYSDQENNMYVISDLTAVYKDQVKSAKRAVSLVNKEYVVVEDMVEATQHFTMMTWTMVTPASAKILSDNVMLLEKDGKKLYVKVEGPKKVRWHISPAQSDFSCDSPNPGISVIGFDMDLELSAKQKIKVFLLPGENKNVTYQSVL